MKKRKPKKISKAGSSKTLWIVYEDSNIPGSRFSLGTRQIYPTKGVYKIEQQYTMPSGVLLHPGSRLLGNKEIFSSWDRSEAIKYLQDLNRTDELMNG
jgi:hypothetical protein